MPLWVPGSPPSPARVTGFVGRDQISVWPGEGITPPAAATITYLQEASNTADLTTYTFSSQNLGTADAARHVIVGVHARANGASAFSLSSASIGGVSATIAVQLARSETNTAFSALIIAAVPTGTTGDIVVTFNRGALRCGVGAYRAIGLTSATAHDFDSDFNDNATTAPLSVNLDIPAGGVAVGASNFANSGANVAWTNLTEAYEVLIESFFDTSMAAAEFASTQTGLTLSADWAATGTETSAVFASWS